MSERKQFQEHSKYEKFDVDSDGIITDEELAREERVLQIENEDKKADAQRKMAWFALGGMLLYPIAVVLAEYVKMGNASKILGDMAGVYFMSVAAIVMAFFGANAWQASKNPPPSSPPANAPRR